MNVDHIGEVYRQLIHLEDDFSQTDEVAISEQAKPEEKLS
jgi:hypothetical protein